MKTLVILLLVLLCLLPATQSLAQQTNFLDTFMDGQTERIVGGGRIGVCDRIRCNTVSPFWILKRHLRYKGHSYAGKLGYASSENLVPYIAGSTDALDFGAMVFLPNILPGFYLDGSFGSL